MFTTMPTLQSLHLFVSILNLFSILVLIQHNLVFAAAAPGGATSSSSTGLTLKLIHIDSPESPLYPGNLTEEERTRRSSQRYKARYLQRKASRKSWRQQLQVRNNNISVIHPDTAKPPVSWEGTYYMVMLGLGTFSGNPTFKNYYFILDTGSSLFWIQCEGCKPDNCFPQIGEPYPAHTSATYRELPCNKHPLCKIGSCRGDSCSYEIEYADDSEAKGVLATEKITVHSDNDGLEEIDNIVFGCGLEQPKDFITGSPDGPTETELVGILGLGGGYRSFLRQLGDRGQMRYSHCLELWTHNKASNTFLRFGDDANFKQGQVVQTIPMFFYRGPTVYYVELEDISVGEIRIGYPKDSFELDNFGVGGCVFDSGTPMSDIAPKLYAPFADHLLQYYTALNVHKIEDEDEVPYPYDLCFTRPNGFNNFPTITFHFQGEDLEIEPEAAFYMINDIFCSAIVESEADDVAVTIGGVQLANYRVLYDVDAIQLSWAREDCVLHS